MLQAVTSRAMPLLLGAVGGGHKHKIGMAQGNGVVGVWRAGSGTFDAPHFVIHCEKGIGTKTATHMSTQNKQSAIAKMREVVAEVIVANADRLAYLRGPAGITCEVTRDVMTNILSRLCEIASVETETSFPVANEELAVAVCRIIIAVNNERLVLSGAGEARSDENAARAYTIFRTAETRALKRALEGIVGSLNPLFIALGQLYMRKGAPPVLRVSDIDLVMQLANNKITLQQFIDLLRQRANAQPKN